jgi:hypothetical protein
VTGRSACVARVRNGRIHEPRASLDAAGMMAQLGLLPQAAPRQEAAA